MLGIALATCSLPLPFSFLAPIPLAANLLFSAIALTKKQVSNRLFWSGFGYFLLHLWWLTTFLGKIFSFPPAGVLAFALFALEGAFLAVMAALVATLFKTSLARLWGLAGGWVILEWLRFLGPLAFPWPTLGYTLLPTPAIQIADLGGVLLGSVLVTFSAATLGTLWLLNGLFDGQAATNKRLKQGRGYPHLLLAALVWVCVLVYGKSRTTAEGPIQPMLTLRTAFDSFGRATHQISPEEQLAQQHNISANRPSDEPSNFVVVWGETALTDSSTVKHIKGFSGAGISGLGTPYYIEKPERNSVVAINSNGDVVGRNEKAKLVPFGEFFIFYKPLYFIYGIIEKVLGFELPNYAPATHVNPLKLNGVSYGVYICYDSVFSWVARSLVNQGAEILVNPSNDGWYEGWGVQQHFMMGRVRAIENRRWLVRSVNFGVAGAVNDLGQPVQIISSGEQIQALSVKPKLLKGQTLFAKVGDSLALALALIMIGYAYLVDRKRA